MVWWLRLGAFTAAARVQSMAWALRSHIKPQQTMAKKNKKKRDTNILPGGCYNQPRIIEKEAKHREVK